MARRAIDISNDIRHIVPNKTFKIKKNNNTKENKENRKIL